MTYVPVVTPPPTPPSPRTRELAGLLTRVLDEYTKAHPATTRAEIRAALSMAVRASSPAAAAPALALAVGLGLALVMGGLVFFFNQGGSEAEFRTALPMVVMALIIFFGLLLVIIKRRAG